MPLVVHAKKILSILIASPKPLNIDQIIDAIVPLDYTRKQRKALRKDFRATLNAATRLGYVHNLSNYYFSMKPFYDLDNMSERLELESEPEDVDEEDEDEPDEVHKSSSDISITSSDSSSSDSSLSENSSSVLKNVKRIKSEKCHKLKIASDLECSSSSSLTLPSEISETSDCEDTSPYMEPWQYVE